jgi:hypothetical protein
VGTAIEEHDAHFVFLAPEIRAGLLIGFDL